MEREQFEQMARRWRQRAYQTSLAHGMDADQADDVAQDTMLKLWAMHGELERYSSVEALATVIARHLSIDFRRKLRLVRLDDVTDQLTDTDAPADAQVIGEQEEQQLLERVAQLPQRQHQVLMMRQVEHRSYDEIASLLGIEPTSARVLLSRARKWLLSQYQTTSDNSLQ